MGLFASIGVVWTTIDNSLYLWNWADPNPDLIGYETQPNSISAVHLVAPKKGVFSSSISHVVVVATAVEIILLGLSRQPNAAGSFDLAFIQTRISTSIRGKDVQVLAASDSTGRIFFGDKVNNDVFELTYQQEERIFSSRCSWINQTTRGLAALTPSFGFGSTPQETVNSLTVDDSRSLLYALSDQSTIRMYHMKAPNTLDLTITLSVGQIFSNLRHMVAPTPLIDQKTRIVSVYPISAQEANKLHLVAITSTGCRIFLSATSSWGWTSSETSAPTNMRVQHVRFPPTAPSQTAQQSGQPSGTGVDTSAQTLNPTKLAYRFGPGYFFCFAGPPEEPMEYVFFSAPDAARIAQSPNGSNQPRYHEIGDWTYLNGSAQDVGMRTSPLSASSQPVGYGNEAAVQFDQPSAEIAILTHTGVEIFHRKRMVDVFVATIRSKDTDEGFDYDIKRSIRTYGRTEVAATALAVACGQGLEQATDISSRHVQDPEILNQARKVFIEYGGKPTFNENSVVDQSIPQIDLVRPSPRHDGMATYMARLLRSIWRQRLVAQALTVQGTITLIPVVSTVKLQTIQKSLISLQDFIDNNKSFIDGLSGRESLPRNAPGQDETAQKAEQRAMLALVELLKDIIEGLSFVLVLFEENLGQVSMLLSEETSRQTQQITYEGLFTTGTGKSLAKELVKAIVNRSIASGSNIESVTDALQRRCGSFCSSGDVIVFRAQEQVKRATESGGLSELSREHLRESLRLFESVAASLTRETIEGVTQNFAKMHFYAGAISLLLRCAYEVDRGTQAAAYVREGSSPKDTRKQYHDLRMSYYNLIWNVLTELENAMKQEPRSADGQPTLLAKRAQEAYRVIEASTDVAFQNALYDWYLEQSWSSRLLEVDSPEVVDYLQRKMKTDLQFGELLWQYHQQRRNFRDAAGVLLNLAKSESELSVQKRVDYLSKAKVLTSSGSNGMQRMRGQTLLRDITDLLDIANLQLDILTRLEADPRTAGRRDEIVGRLSHGILPVSDLFNHFANQAGYWDLCLVVFQISDFRNTSEIKATWNNLIEQAHNDAVAAQQAEPWEVVAERVRATAQRLGLAETVVPVPALVRLLQEYHVELQPAAGAATWVSDVFLGLGVPPSQLFDALERMLYVDLAPLDSAQSKRFVYADLLHVVLVWYGRSRSGGGGGGGGAERGFGMGGGGYEGGMDAEEGSGFEARRGQVLEALGTMLAGREGLGGLREEVRMAKVRIEQGLR